MMEACVRRRSKGREFLRCNFSFETRSGSGIVTRESAALWSMVKGPVMMVVMRWRRWAEMRRRRRESRRPRFVNHSINVPARVRRRREGMVGRRMKVRESSMIGRRSRVIKRRASYRETKKRDVSPFEF